MKIFLTGGTGFLGSEVIRHLQAGGHAVTTLARTAAAATKLRAAGTTPVLGDLESIDSWAEGLAGHEVVVHAAAPVEFWGRWSKFQHEIVDASIRLAAAAEARGVRRFIQISSESVMQDAADLVDVDESFPCPKRPNSSYGLAKKLAEEGLLAPPSKMVRIVLRPTFIWGHGCPAMTEIAAKVASGAFVWVDEGRAAMEAVHVGNVAHATLLACRRGSDRGIYLITDDERATVREFFTRYFESVGVRPPTKSVPLWVAKPAAATLELLWRLLRLPKPPPMSRFELAFVAMARRYKIDRARRELGYAPLVSRGAGFADVAARLN